MSSEYPQEFLYLLLFGALSGRPFTKTELGLKMTGPKILELAQSTGLLEIERKGGSLKLNANRATIAWADAHLNIELTGRSRAVLTIHALLRAKTAGFLKARGISLEELLHPHRDPPAAAPPAPQPAASGVAAEAEIRRAYLDASSGDYDKRVLLKDLRQRLRLPREQQDQALLALARSGYADLYPEDDPRSRSEEDERAALILSDRSRHVVYLSREPRV